MGTLKTVTPADFKPIVTEPVAALPLLLADLETVYQEESYIDTLILEDVQVALEPVYVKLPLNIAFQLDVPFSS